MFLAQTKEHNSTYILLNGLYNYVLSGLVFHTIICVYNVMCTKYIRVYKVMYEYLIYSIIIIIISI